VFRGRAVPGGCSDFRDEVDYGAAMIFQSLRQFQRLLKGWILTTAKMWYNEFVEVGNFLLPTDNPSLAKIPASRQCIGNGWRGVLC